MHPTRFRSELQRFDRSLDLEWNGRKSRWEIIGTDRKQKRYLIKVIPLGQLDLMGPATLQELYDASPIKQGGAKELNRRLDRIKEEEEKQIEKEAHDAVNDRLDEAWVHFQYREGRRVSFVQGKPEDGKIKITDHRRLYDSPSGE